jgi:2-aminoadipate transaminase
VVLVELPTYTGAITAFRNVQAQLVGVPQEADGVDFDALERICQRLRSDGQRVKALYVVPNFQNPTGLLIGLEKRRRLLEWAARRDVLLIEDDPYHDLYFEDSATPSEVRSIKAGDRDGRVVYLSSFSKTLAPGYRVAWIAAPAPIAQKIEIAKQSEDLLTGSLDQRIVYEACRSGLLARQLPKLRRHYGEKRDVMTRTLRRELSGAVTWPDPKGGFFLWLTLPDQLDTDLMIPRAVDHGVVYVAGEAFFVQGDVKSTMRLSFSAPTQEQIEEGVVRLARTVREELETVSASLRAPGQAAR